MKPASWRRPVVVVADLGFRLFRRPDRAERRFDAGRLGGVPCKSCYYNGFFRSDLVSAMSKTAMNATERRTAFSLAGLFAFRMLGMFMILPIFTLYGTGYTGYTPTLAGLAIGAYGMTQALLQIPFGSLSDRFGRKPIILAGLALFALGSLAAAMATSIYGVILGRALQGAGAIAGPVLALAADLTREDQRTKVMAIIGISIGAAFGLAQILGPVVAHHGALSGVFWLTAGLALAGMAIIVLAVPTPVSRSHEREVSAQGLKAVLQDPQLLRMDFGIFALHLVMTATLMTVPVMLVAGGLPAGKHSWVYLGAMLGAILALGPLMRQARRGKARPVLLATIILLAGVEAGLALVHGQDWHLLALLLLLFYVAFNYLESSLPALISRLAPSASKGAALGVYATAQFLGAALGGSLGGWLLGHVGVHGVFVFGAAVAGLWFLVMRGLAMPIELASHSFHVGKELSPAEADALLARLLELPGVRSATLVDGVVHLQVEPEAFDAEALAGLTSLG